MKLLALLSTALMLECIAADEIVFTIGGTNRTSSLTNFGITTEAVFTLTTNWVDDPVNSSLQLGIIYSNIIARVSYEGKTNDVTMASKLVGLAGTRKFEQTTTITNWISTNLYIGPSIVWPIAKPEGIYN